MTKKITLWIAVLLLTAVAAFSQNNQSLSMQGWNVWGGLRAAAQGNTVTFNGNVATAGYDNNGFNRNMRGRTIILEIQNAEASVFSEDRMLKITYNQEEIVIWPYNVMQLIHNEYIPPSYQRIEFELPEDFNGRLNLVFYQANLNNLRITAWFR